MKKFLFSLSLLSLIITAEFSFANKQYLFVPKMQHEKANSIQNWMLKDFPFLNLVILPNNQLQNLVYAPTTVRWPASAVQNFGSADCGSVSINVTVEVFLAGITDANPTAAGTNMACVAHIGKVNAFGSGCATPQWDCIQNFPMSYAGADTGDGFDVFSTTITNLPPGLYEVTCACADNGPFIDPYSNPEVRWIGADCPGANTFTNGHYTVNPTATNDLCTASPINVNTGTNSVNNNCSEDGRVWFSYTVPAGRGNQINFTVSGGTLASPQIYSVIRTSCGGTNEVSMLPLECVMPGTVLYIEAGNQNTTGLGLCHELGTFTLNISDPLAPTNDVCTGASTLNNFGGDNQLTCGESGSFMGDPNACPDAAASACFGTTTEGVWYTFTTSAALSEFSITGTYELFTGTCGALTSLGCVNTNQPNIPGGGTYYLLVGPTGNVTVTAAPAPTNDLCAGAIVVNIGLNTNLTNSCASQDVTPCPGNVNQASVWYSLMTGANDDIVTITSNLSGSVVKVYRSCGGALVPDADMLDCDASARIECEPMGTYFIYVSSSTADAGTFNLNITATSNGVANDDCSGATVILNSPVCTWNVVTPVNTTGACPENFTVNACGLDFSAQPSVYYTFTTPADVTSIEIRNITANGTLAILNTCPVAAGSTTALGGCLTGAGPHGPLTVMPNTQYWVVIAGTTPGNYGFEIKYNDPPDNDECTGAIALGGTMTNECSTQDLMVCGTASEASVWYTYTVPANVKELTFTLNGLTNGVIRVYDACGGTLLGDSDCDNTVEIECPTSGDVYRIFIASPAANAGMFTVTVNTTPVTAANDVCANATTLNIGSDCLYDMITTSNVGACPETFSFPCNGGNTNVDATVWLEFTPPAGATSINIRNITPAGAYLAILPSCGAGSTIPGGGCTSGAGPTPNIAVTAGTTYKILAAIAGTEGIINFEIKYNIPPANDECTGAIALGGTMTNECSTQDLMVCGTASEASVWYTYTVPANVKELTFTLNGLTNGVIRVYDACGGTLLGDSGCDNTVEIECPTAGDVYRIFIASPTANTGMFTVTVNTTPVTAANDVCANATTLNIGSDCLYDMITTSTVGACPETFSFPCNGGNTNTDATVWLEFTPPAGATSINIRNITPAGAYLAILPSCGAGSTIPGGGCTSGAGPTPNIAVTAGTTYKILAAIAGTEGSISFEIKYNIPPANDECAGAIVLGGTMTNECSTQDLMVCGTSSEASVWYTYTIPDNVKELTFTLNGLTNGVIRVYDACGGTLLGDSGCDNTVEIECPTAGDVYRIFIASPTANTGMFTVTVNTTPVTAANDVCTNATTLNIGPDCLYDMIMTSTVGACPETFSFPCNGGNTNTDATVWLEFTPPAGATSINIRNITPAGAYLAILPSCGAASTIPGGGCLNGAGPTPNIAVTAGTTYKVLAAIAGTEGSINFEIKYNIQQANDDPCMGGFVPTVLSNGTPLSMQNNVCSTQDNNCGAAQITNSLWYSFTLTAPNDRLTINVTGLTSPSISIYNQANPCGQAPVNEECNGDGMAEFNCLQPGTYLIMMGTSAANAGDFTITATQGTNAGVPNDLCQNATVLPGQPYDLCVFIGPFPSTNIDACPESGLTSFGNCNFQIEETSWYSFVAPGTAGQMPTMDFRFTSYSGTGTPFMGLFTGGCGSLTNVTTSCLSGLNTTFGNIGPLTPGQTYYLALSSFGDTGGNFNFEIRFNVGPPNDDECHSASGYNLGDGGSIDATNLCSGADFTIPGCPATSSQNSVWFTFTVNPGSYGINIRIDAIDASPTPLVGPIAAGVFTTACTNPILETSTCLNNRQDGVLDCLEPGTYSLQISTSNIEAGDFTITTSQLVDNRSCPSGPLSDVCEDAIVINMGGIVCTPVPVSGCNINACPESFTSGGCNFHQNPTVWYTFTVDANAASIDITQMTAGYNYAILTGSPCTDNPVVGLAGYLCLNAANTLNVPVTGGQTYYLIVSNPNGGQFSFNIIQNVFPENDDPNTSSPRPPFVLSLGGSHQGTTCCALGFNDGPNLDTQNLACSAATHDGAVWYTYTTGTEVGVTITVTPSGPAPISGATTVEVLSGGANSPANMLFNNSSYSCGALPAVVKIGCFDPGEIMWIKVASQNQFCGTFNITIEPLNQCPLAETCPDATDITTIGPIDPSCSTVANVTINGCLEAACPETTIANCGMDNLPTVWFQIQTTSNQGLLSTTVSTGGSWQPIWSVYYGGCAGLTPIATIVPPPGTGVLCSNDNPNPNVHAVPVISGENNYWIAVSGDGVIDDPNFVLSISQLAGCISCIGSAGCAPSASWTVTQRSSTRPLTDPFFCQGEEVRFCVNFTYDPTGSVAEWIHAVIPDFGPGWDMDVFNPASITMSPGGSSWQSEDNGACAPRISETMPFLCTYTDPVTGRIKLCNAQCQSCPCSPPLLAGTALPSGWYWISNGGSGCVNDCRPQTHWGLPGSSVPTNINFCLNMKVRTFDTEAECNQNRSLRFSFQTTSDGVSGCWQDAFECKFDYAQIGPNWQIDCDRPPRILSQDREFCVGGFTNIPLSNDEGASNVVIIVTPIPNPNVTGANSHTFTGGSGILNDNLQNNTSAIQIQQYEAYAQVPGFICPSPLDTITVTLYPQLLVNFPNYALCPENEFGQNVNPIVSGGSGVYTGTSIPFVPGYQWSTGSTGPSIVVMPTATTSYTVTVTDDKGCSSSGTAIVEVLNPISFTLAPEQVSLCGVSGSETVTISNIVTNGGQNINWNIPFGLNAFASGNTLTINALGSLPSFVPYQVYVTIVDNRGCTLTKFMEVRIGEAASGELTFTPPACGGPLTTNIGVGNFSSPGNFANTFTLLDCNGDAVFGNGAFYVIYSHLDQFQNVSLASNNCYRILIESRDIFSGELICSLITDPVTIPIPTGVPVTTTPDRVICIGESTSIGITNPANYTSFSWNPPQGNVSNFMVSPTATTAYSVTATQSNGCTSVRNVLVTVNQLPTPGITGSTSFCPGDNTSLNASGGVSYQWSGPGSFMSSVASTGPIDEPGTYKVTVTNANGCVAIDSVIVIESDQLTIVVPNLALCDNQPDSLDAGSGFATYTWTDAGGTVLSTVQKLEVNTSGFYTISVTDGNCSGETTVNVTNSNSPILTLPDTIQVCRISNGTGEFPTVINFEAIASLSSGTWFNTDAAPVDVSDWSNVSFTTVPARDTFNFTYVTNTALNPCVDVSAVLVVVARNCTCPSPVITLPILCNSRTAPFLLNNNWIGTPPPGVWSVESGPAPLPVIVNNNEISVNGIAEGTYRLLYTYTPPLGGSCDQFIARDLLVFGASQITVQDAVLCNKTTGSDPTVLNLNTLITSLSEPSPGTWSQISGDIPAGTLPLIDATNMTPQILVFEYTTSAITPPCQPEKATVQIRIRDCDCIDITVLPDTLCNGSMAIVDLMNPVKFIANPATVSGTWTAPAPLIITGGRFLNPSGVPLGTYTATFTVDDPQGPGCTTSYNKTIIIRNQPVASLRTDSTACAVNTGNGPTSINLFTLLNPGYSTGGSWTQVSPSVPALTIPATGIVDFTGQAVGSEFIFRYMLNAQSPCNQVNVDAKVTVRDCNCPDAETNPPSPLCNDSGILDLNSLFNNPNTIAPGSWTATGPSGVVNLVMGSVLNAMGLQEGNYTLTYTLNPVPGGGCPRFSVETLRINDLKTAVLATDTVVCNQTSPLGSSILNLSDLVRSGSYGIWRDQNGDLVLTPTAVNFTGQSIGSTFIYTYEIENEDPCVNQTYPVSITVIDCACEQIVLGTIPSVCTDQGSIDLKAFSDPKPGTWTASNPALIIANGVLTLTGVPTGVYQLTYTLTNAEPGCPTSRNTTISVFAPRNAGTPTTAQFCADASEVVVLNNLLAGEDTGGTWTATSGNVGTEFNATAGTFNITGKTPGTYTFRYAFSGQQPCPDANATVTVIINALPIADVGANPRNINCTIQNTVLGGNNTSSGPTISYTWTFNGEIVANTREYTADRGGVYTLTVINTETGCSDTKNVQVIQADDLPIFDIAIDSIKCFGQRATITVSNIRGGLAPYQVSFNNGTNWGNPTVASNLGAGTYKVLVRDANGCVNDQLPAIVIIEPPLLTVSLGNDITLNLNEDTLLTLTGSFIPANIRSIVWKKGNSEIPEAANQFSYLAQPDADTDYSVTMTDLNGCVATDVLRISIRRLNPECIPNIFTPNDRPDNQNDYFSINCQEVDEVLKYRIFDRWGNLIFISDNIVNTGTTIDQTRFWDGKFKGKFVVPGVYVYYIELKFKNGEIEKRAGDVTVLR